ncbi:hypothetical protein HDU83_007381 [Entophlyctis luteolus]|nr:hypothetical protein HDU83_007381 [Entophlyctis luteolus]
MANLTSLLDANGAVHDEEIVARLQDRFSHDLVHSHIGSVNLVSINPYKRVFVPAHTEYDLEKICADSYSVQPHPFDIASAAYLHMVRAVEDQVILTWQWRNDILKTEIVLECFGNAETAKNKNSTRYSRYSELRFNDDGTIVGAKIQEYLFDSSRVPDCPAEDCNFHIFYMLVNGATSEERTKWLLPSNDTKSYHIFKGKRTSTMTEQYPQIDVLKKSLKSLGFSKRNINELLNTIAGIIHLMNVEFTMEEQGKGYGAYVKNKTELEAAAKLFSVSADKLEASITTASYLDGDTICSAFLDVEKSCKARNSLADVIYHLVFKWIIEQINVHLGTSRIGGGVFVTQIGLLDIAGFEDRSPHSNNFDQFMCNYANEKLQTFLLKRSINFIPFTVAADGVSATGFCRPQPVDTQILDFYDDPSTGLFQIVDQETYTKGENAKDLSLLANIEVCFGSGKSRFYESGSDGHSFKVKHYTGKGTSYDIHGFVSKNRNNFYSDVINLFGVTLGTTTGKQKPRTFIAGLFTESVVKAVLHPKDGATMVSARPAAPQGPSLSMEGGARKKSSSMLLSCSSLQSTNSLAGQKKHKVAAEAAVSALSCLKTSIDVLLDALNEMRSWTIVCINPNDTAEPDRFDFNKVLKQIQSYKVREITQASAFDYTVGIEFVDFMERFGKVHADSWRNFESRLDRLSNQMDESEGRKIYLITDQKGVQCTPGFIRKSMGSINALDDTEKKADDLKLEDDEIMHKKSKSIFSLHKRKHSDETDVEEELAKSAEPAAEKPKIIERMSKTRRQWVYFTWCVTWWIPDYLLHKLGKMSQPGVRMAWREKVAICFIVAMLSAVMLFFVQGLGKLLCPLENYFSLSELSAHSKWGGMDLFVAYNGYIYDITGFSHPGGSIIDSAGLDVSSYFPRFNAESGVPFSNHCGFLTTIQTPVNALPSKRDQYENRRMSQSSSGSLAERDDLYTFSPDPTYLEIDNTTSQLICSMPSLPEYIGWCHDTVAIDEFVLKNEVKNVAQVGLLAFPHTELQKHNTVDDWWVAINGKIYNISVIAGSNTIYSIDASQFDINFLGSPGSDASSNSSRLSQSVLQCFDDFLLIGFVDNRASSIGCNASAYILYTVTGIMVAVMVVKFLAALQLGPSPNPEGHDRFVIMQVPCYNEGEASLTKTIQSLATFEYDDTRKLLFIVSDGMIKSAGSDLSTPDIVLQILGVDKSVQIPEAKSYLAIGRGLKEHNKAKVYAGLYSIQARYVPYIYVCKVGKDGETVKPGNRGKRDSQMILMKFINRVHFGTPMSPLELEMYHQIKNIIGVDPFLYEYCLMVDADTRVEAQSLNRLISCMVNDANTMGICGETRIENENESWVTMMQVNNDIGKLVFKPMKPVIQVYEYYISHHLAKAFESLFGSVTCLPGCFCMVK